MSFASVSFRALGTTATLCVTDASALPRAHELLDQELREIDEACSRFRDDSELARLNAAAGERVVVGTRLFEAVAAALRAAAASAGLVDPTIGRALRLAGYDRTFALVRARDGSTFRARFASVPGWRRIELDAARRTVRIPRGVELDLGATAKALAADRAAQAAARATGAGVLVSLGGDIAVAGTPPPAAGRSGSPTTTPADLDAPGPTVSILQAGSPARARPCAAGARATSSCTTSSIPRTGRPAEHAVADGHRRGRVLRRCERREHRGRGPRGRRTRLAGSTRPAGTSCRQRGRGLARRRLAGGRAMTGVLAASGNAKALWYLTRGTGTVALLLLTVSILLGVTTSTRWRSARWPRFLVNGLHRNVTLLALAFVVVHVVTTIADGYAPVGFVDAILPFHSAYRPVWLGLGAVAFDLLLALIVTSLLRARIGFKTWRAVHWLAYASWPVALVHALGTGSDARTLWLQVLGVLCAGSVVAAVLWRVATARGGTVLVRSASVFAAFAVPIGVFVWAQVGPWQRGWAARAGTPKRLLASARTPVVRTSLTLCPRGSRLRFRAGRSLHLHRPDLAVADHERLRRRHDRCAGQRRLRGPPAPGDPRRAAQGGGVQMVDSVVGLLPTGAPAWSSGQVTALAGTQVAADVRSPDGRTVHLTMTLKLDSVAGVRQLARGLHRRRRRVA